MSLIDLDAIPGYREACEKERENRNLAVLALTVPLCGVSAHQLMPRHVCLLTYCQNAFLGGGAPPQPEDIAFFLWAVSPDYCLDVKKRDRFIKAKVANLPYARSCREIFDYLDRAFQDSPGRSGSGGTQYVAPVVFLIDLFASQYGWTDEKTMTTPLAALFQYMKAMRMRTNPRAPIFNPSDVIKSRFLVGRITGEGQN